MDHPFADLIDLRTEEQADGRSRLSLVVAPAHLNPHQVVHGAVLYAMADTGMGAALYPSLAAGEICATIEIKINYFKPVSAGTLSCITQVVNRGRTVANLESRLFVGDMLVAQANGNYAIFTPRTRQPGA
jgi:acyl-CoA thioesterase